MNSLQLYIKIERSVRSVYILSHSPFLRQLQLFLPYNLCVVKLLVAIIHNRTFIVLHFFNNRTVTVLYNTRSVDIVDLVFDRSLGQRVIVVYIRTIHILYYIGFPVILSILFSSSPYYRLIHIILHHRLIHIAILQHRIAHIILQQQRIAHIILQQHWIVHVRQIASALVSFHRLLFLAQLLQHTIQLFLLLLQPVQHLQQLSVLHILNILDPYFQFGLDLVQVRVRLFLKGRLIIGHQVQFRFRLFL